INVMDGATVKGDIISEWNPEGVEYFYTRDYGGENPYKGLKPNIPAGANLDNYRTNLNLAGNRTFTDNIIGPYGLIMNVNSGNLITANASAEDSSYINVHSVNVGNGATYTVNNVLMANNGYGTINVMGNGSLALAEDITNNSVGTILISFNDNDGDGKAKSGIINNEGKISFENGELALKPDGVYFEENTKVKILKKANDNDNGITDGEKFSGIWFVDMNGEKAQVAESDNDSYKITKTLTMTAEQGSGSESNFVSITTERSFKDVELGKDETAISQAIENVDGNINNLANERKEDWKDMLSVIDFMKTDREINNALGQLLPTTYGYGAMATMDLHRMLSDFAVGGSLAHATNVKEKGKWHNIVIPYASETDHIKNGSGYKNNHTGMIGAMERTLDDVTVGWHAALNHQSTTGAESGRLKGEGIYLGAQVKYAPESWKGWSAFGIARLGVEDLEMQREFNFNSYTGKVDSDFTAFSGNVRVGGAYEKEAKAITFGPFAAIDYAFAHHPSIDEEGNSAGRLSLDSGTYDSLRTQVGYRMQTAPKILEDRTYWQANAAIAWNHELLDDAGSISASFRDFDGNSFGCDVDNYGRDSLSLMAGMTFKNPTKLDVTFNLGTDIYRHGGNTLYAKCALEWNF
ncbi:MAG: autotransporter domain-containing protein, partial [Phascolarctobacterium sp.]|nr:autotransporter domain-containing protein [Phascolarctobacterium sp.]